jgi:hypothetical protein
MKHAIFILGALMLSDYGVATAQSQHWLAERFTQSMDQKGSAAGDYTYSGVKVASRNPDVPEIRFGCSERYGLTATLTFLPLSQADPAPNSRFKLRQKTTNLKIEGRETERVPWTVIKETRTVQTRSGKHAAMIYNAVVQQRPFVVKEPYKKEITITPPPVDPHFVFFVESCEVTSGS